MSNDGNDPPEEIHCAVLDLAHIMRKTANLSLHKT